MTSSLSEDTLIEKYVAKNAIDYGGTASPKAVIGKILAENPDLKPQAKALLPRIEKYCEHINQLSVKEQQQIVEKYAYPEKEEKELALPNAEEGQVVMRLAPFPSGPLHIGNARMAVLNDELVKKYSGILILVIDDTAGSQEKQPIPEAYDMIPQDLEWLQVDWQQTVYKSDRLETYYAYGKQFLKSGWAYVCQCDPETLRHNRKEGKACACRSQSLDRNIELWEQMHDGAIGEGEAAVRLKTDMGDKDPAFRDRVIFRISEQHHPRVGTQYRVWPLLEFSWALDDYLLGVTHILRGKDLMMETRMEQFIWELLGWKQPTILHHGTLQFDVDISKSTSQRKIADNMYSGWKDPRTWSLLSLQERGIQPEAVRSFVLNFGLSETDVQAPIKTLYKENRSLIDAEANRYFFISQPVSYTVVKNDTMTAQIPVHPDQPERGQRTLSAQEQVYIEAHDGRETEVRLKGLGNFAIEKHTLTFVDNAPERAQKEKLPIIHWLPVDDAITATVVLPNGAEQTGFVERHVLHEQEDDIIQCERYGFCRINDLSQRQLYYTHD